ncbi:MAG TPA: glycosyltransferase [Gemmatimonadales bacterium]|nr:glycosyltransferase [Gemmatimonadales bacterium]
MALRVSIRWFAPNAQSRSIIPALAARDVHAMETDGQPADLAIGMGDAVAEEAWHWSATHNRPLILYLWDLPPWSIGKGHFNHVISLGPRLLTLPRVGRRSDGRRAHFSRVRWIARHAAEVWVPGRQTAAVVERLFHVECREVGYGIDATWFTPDPKVQRDTGSVVCVAPLLPHGNLSALIRTAARSAPKLELRLIGDGPERPGLELLAADLGVVCRFEATADPEVRRRAFRTAGAVICPSRYEGFGGAALEALACGASVVVSDTPSHREILGGAAHYFGLDDDVALATALRTALASPSRGAAIPQRYTLERAAERFTAGILRVTGA